MYLVTGQTSWSMSRDSEGHRTYKVVYLVAGTRFDGPANALQCPGLPTPGAYWAIDNDLDLWAWCRWDADVQPVVTDEPNNYFKCAFVFSTKPPDRSKGGRSCRQSQVEDPLLEPMKVSGHFSKYHEEAKVDLFGKTITNSAWEMLKGPSIEFDASRHSIRISQNVALLELELFEPMIDTLNNAPLWNRPRRTIKLSNVSWEKKYHGQCNYYYTRTLEFDIRKTWDRNEMDEGTKVLNGRWGEDGAWELLPIGIDEEGDPIDPDPDNPAHFIQYKDKNGENTRVQLNGKGEPYDPISYLNDPFYFDDGTIELDENDTPPATNDSSISAPDDLSAEIMRDEGQLDTEGIYRYRVTAVDSNGVETDGSNELVVAFTEEGRKVKLSWGKVTGARYYRIYRMEANEEEESYDPITDYGFLEEVGAHVKGMPGRISIVFYPESNFLLLGIPTVL